MGGIESLSFDSFLHGRIFEPNEGGAGAVQKMFEVLLTAS